MAFELYRIFLLPLTGILRGNYHISNIRLLQPLNGMVYEKLKNIYEEHFYIRIFTNILLNSFLVGRINHFSFEQIKNENPLLFPPRRYYQQILLPHEQNN